MHSVNEKKAIACRTSSTHACLRAAARNAPAEATGVRARRGAERGGEGTGEERGRWCLHSVRCERESKLLGAAAAGEEEATADVAPPLYTILRAIIDEGYINGDGSLFEAKQGHKPALLVPKARPGRVEMGKLGMET